MVTELRMNPRIAEIEMPENLAIGLMVAEHRARCREHGCSFDYVTFALGQSPFPVPEMVAAALAAAANRSEYGSALGIDPLRAELSGFWQRHFAQTIEPERFVVTPGPKFGLLMAMAVLEGPLIVPTRPGWATPLSPSSLGSRS